MAAMRVAIVCSAHGFGHVGRELAVAAECKRRGLEPVFFTHAPDAMLDGAARIPWTVDAGIAQLDSLREDPEATLPLLEERCSDAAIDRLADALAPFERVIVDVAPAALEAARRAGRPAVAVGNFDWAWIYRHYPPLLPWAERFARWAAPHPAVQLWPGPGMHGFADVVTTGLLARSAAPAYVGGVLVCFGGLGLDGLDALLPRIPGITWILAPPSPRLDRDDARYVDTVPFPSLVAGADAVLTKPGYGIFGECALAGTPIVWLERGVFPEAPYLERAMWARGDVRAAAHPEGVAEALRRVLGRPRAAAVVTDAAARVVERVLAATEPAA